MAASREPHRAAEPHTAPLTVPIEVHWWTPLRPRAGWDRIRGSWVAIVQIVTAATGAYAFATYVLGHPAPLLAATVTVSSLGLVRDARVNRVLETVIGMIVGILVAEALLLVAGTGWWQMALALTATLLVARFLSPQPGFAIAAAIQSLIVMILPTSAPMLRLVDGLVGGVAALLVTILIPRSPQRTEVSSGEVLFTRFASATDSIVRALRRGDRVRAQRGLEKARALQPDVDDWRTTIESGQSIAKFSPFLRAQRTEIARHLRVWQGMDFASRNLRVIARRTVYLVDDRTPRPIAADLLADIARGAEVLAQSLTDISLEPAAREALRAVAVRLDPTVVMPDASLGDQNLIAALRPLVVDLLTAAGMSPDEAARTVPRI